MELEDLYNFFKVYNMYYLAWNIVSNGNGKQYEYLYLKQKKCDGLPKSVFVGHFKVPKTVLGNVFNVVSKAIEGIDYLVDVVDGLTVLKVAKLKLCASLDRYPIDVEFIKVDQKKIVLDALKMFNEPVSASKIHEIIKYQSGVAISADSVRKILSDLAKEGIVKRTYRGFILVRR